MTTAPSQDRGEPPALERVFAARFRARSVIREDRSGATLRGEDERGRAVAIKTLRRRGGGAAHLDEEAEILRGLRSPHVSTPVAAGRDADGFYFVTPWIDGEDLAARVRLRPLSVREALRVARDVLSALAEAHALDVIHRNVKPTNIVVRGANEVESAVLVDFAFAAVANVDPELTSLSAASVRYVSPEQARLLDRPFDGRADLYSLGVTLFECLTGAPLFDGATVGEVLRQHLSVDPPSLVGVGVSAPRALDAILRRLVKRDPRDRYQSARGALADVDALAQRLSAGDKDPEIAIGVSDPRPVLTEASFVGRRRELASIEEDLALAQETHGRVTLVASDSGAGKSRLLDEVAASASARGMWVLRIQGKNLVAPQPMETLEPLARMLAARAREDRSFGARLRAVLGDVQAAVGEAFPALAEVLDSNAPAVDAPEEHGAHRTAEAVARMLEALGARGRPAIILLDDAQWADGTTLLVLDRWTRRRRAAREDHRKEGAHLGIVVAFRREEVDDGHPLRALDAHTVELGPLADDDLRGMLESMAGPLPDAAVKVVSGLAGGNPLLATAVLYGLVEGRSLERVGDEWRVVPDALDRGKASRRAVGVLLGLLEHLPARAKRLLGIGALLGTEFDLSLAFDLAGMSAGDGAAALAEGRRRHLVWTCGDGLRAKFVHDKIRETLLAEMTPAERRILHMAAATRIEELDRDRVFELSQHFGEGGAPERAYPYAIAAAERARKRYAFEAAEHHYRRAEEALDARSEEERRAVAEALGDVLRSRGSYKEAEARYIVAVASATGADRARIESKMGELSAQRGDSLRACEHFAKALAHGGVHVPLTRGAMMLRLVAQIVIQILHTFLPKRLFARSRHAAPNDETFAIHVLERMMPAAFFAFGPTGGALVHLILLNRVEQYPDDDAVQAPAISGHALMLALSGAPLHARCEAFAERALVLARNISDLSRLGYVLSQAGVALWCRGRFEDAEDAFRRSIAASTRAGDRWNVHITTFHLALLMYEREDADKILVVLKRVFEDAVRVQDAGGAAAPLLLWSTLTAGAGLPATPQSWLRRDPMSAFSMALVDAQRARHAGRFAEAVATVEAANAKMREAGHGGQVLVYSALVHCAILRDWIAATPPYAASVRRDLVARARRVAGAGARFARKWPTFRAATIRELGLLCALAGDADEARRLLKESARAAGALGQTREMRDTAAARAMIEGALAHAATSTGRSPDAAAASELSPREDGRPADASISLSLADRFDRIVDAGRSVASSLTKEAVFASLRQAASSLLRGQSCVVLEIAGHLPDGSLRLVRRFGRDVDPNARDVRYHPALVARAHDEGKPALLSEDDVDGTETARFGAQSHLCAPISVRRRIVAFFYVAHDDVGALFGEEEVRLAQFLGALAGVALENAEATRTLERRVEERTRELSRANEDLDLRLRELRGDRSDPKRIVAELVERARVGAEARGVAVALDLDASLPAAATPRAAIEAALAVALGVSVSAAARGTKAVRVAATSASVAGARIRIRLTSSARSADEDAQLAVARALLGGTAALTTDDAAIELRLSPLSPEHADDGEVTRPAAYSDAPPPS